MAVTRSGVTGAGVVGHATGQLNNVTVHVPVPRRQTVENCSGLGQATELRRCNTYKCPGNMICLRTPVYTLLNV